MIIMVTMVMQTVHAILILHMHNLHYIIYMVQTNGRKNYHSVKWLFLTCVCQVLTY